MDDIPRLIDVIVSTHHAYVRSAMPSIARHLAALAELEGAQHPELERVADCFRDVAAELSHHMVKEEQVLFPYVRDLALAGDRAARTPSPFGTVANPIRMMEREHQEIAEAMTLIRELTRGYATPRGASAAHAVAMAELDEFERDLHRHVHLENDVLFPAAMRLEARLRGAPENGA